MLDPAKSEGPVEGAGRRRSLKCSGVRPCSRCRTERQHYGQCLRRVHGTLLGYVRAAAAQCRRWSANFEMTKRSLPSLSPPQGSCNCSSASHPPHLLPNQQ
eukprot:72475-Hanusia_phi.AAC.3